MTEYVGYAKPDPAGTGNGSTNICNTNICNGTPQEDDADRCVRSGQRRRAEGPGGHV
ncbi:MAG: hypothetical protein WKF57_17260 [Nakamurella sp.]